ncbi:MAG: hypothetical protein JKX97_00465 [Candidatus Lindowbacteria bacterium]|nr:hypothetical protein [Candidatus Lindowbacteria bacterium]
MAQRPHFASDGNKRSGDESEHKHRRHKRHRRVPSAIEAIQVPERMQGLLVDDDASAMSSSQTSLNMEESSDVDIASDAVSDAGSDVAPPYVPEEVKKAPDALQKSIDRVQDPAMVEDDRPVYAHTEFAACTIPADAPEPDNDDDDGNNDDWCFLCEFRENEHAFAVGSDYMLGLYDLISSEYCKVSPRAFTSAVQTYYNDKLRSTMDGDMSKRVWKRRVILAHIEVHAPTKVVDTQWSLSIVRNSMRVLAKRLQLQNVADHADCKLDKDNVKLFLQLQTTSSKLNEKVSSMIETTQS